MTPTRENFSDRNRSSASERIHETPLQGQSLVVEIAGLPGTGKSVLADAVMQRLTTEGVTTTDVTSGFGPTTSTMGRVTRKTSSLSRAVLTRPSLRGIATVAVGVRQPSVRDRIVRPANLVVAAELTRRARTRVGINVMDQGVTQDSWSLALRADREQALARLERILSVAPLPDLIVYVEAARSALVERLEARPSRHSRLQRQPRTQLRDELKYGGELFESIFASLAMRPAGQRPSVVRIDGTRDDSADQTVELLRAKLEVAEAAAAR